MNRHNFNNSIRHLKFVPVFDIDRFIEIIQSVY